MLTKSLYICSNSYDPTLRVRPLPFEVEPFTFPSSQMKKMRRLLQFREQMGSEARVHSDSGAPSPTFILTPVRENMSKWVSERATA